jgi:predicted MFS family arabinose efflux permease
VLVVVLAAAAAQTFASMGTSTLPVIAPKLAEVFGVEAALIGIQVSILYGAAAAGAVLAGGLVRRLGACRVSQLALGCTLIGVSIAALPSLAFVAFSAIPIGLAIGILSPAAAHMMLRFAPPAKLNLIFSIKQTGVPLGHMLSALTAPILALTVGWRWSLALVALVCAASIVLFELRRREWDDDRDPSAPLMQSPLVTIRSVWRHPALRWLVLASSAFSAVQVCVTTFTATLLVVEAGYGLVQAGAVLSVVNFSGVAARVGWGWVADRWKSGTAVLVLIGVVMAVAAGIAAFLTSAWPPVAVLMVFAALGISAIGWNGVMNAEVARRSPKGEAGSTTSGYSFFVFGAILVMPVLFSALYALIGSYSGAYGVLSLLALAGLGLLWLSHRHMRAATA